MTKSNKKDPTELLCVNTAFGLKLERKYVQLLYDCIIRRRNFITAQQKSFGRVTDAQQQDLNDIAALEPKLQLALK